MFWRTVLSDDVDIKKWVEKLTRLTKEYYLFVLCAFWIIIGFKILHRPVFMQHGATDAIELGRHIVEGLKALGGSILIGASLICLAINRNRPTQSNHD